VPVAAVLEPEVGPELASFGATALAVDVLVGADVCGSVPGGTVWVGDPAACELELSVGVVP
jgi:hypothetical protein